ncbi:hypothetical protein [Schlesneria sp. DSM 10557]
MDREFATFLFDKLWKRVSHEVSGDLFQPGDIRGRAPAKDGGAAV